MRTVRHLWTHAAHAAGAAMLLGGIAQASAAQDAQPVVMVHGFISKGDTWDRAAARLRSEFNVRTTQPDLTWSRPYGDQAASLRGMLAGNASAFPDTTVFVGHSNGGLISRETVRQGQPVKSIVTVGSPHAGAPLALGLNVLPTWGAFISIVNADPIWYYWGYLGEWSWISITAGSLNAVMSTYGAGMSLAGSYIVGSAGSGVLPDMVPGSDALSRLNGGDNLAREAQTVPVRVGIQSYLDQPLVGVMFHGLAGANGAGDYGTAIQYASIFFDLIAYDYYASYYWDWGNYYSYDLAAGSYLWLNAAFTNAAIDPVWCGLVGVPGTTSCDASDGIVPLANQYYPGGANYTVQGPSHVDETESRQTVDQVVSVLRYAVGVGGPVTPPYDPPPDPPPYDPPCGDNRIICEPMMQSAPAQGMVTQSVAPSAALAASQAPTASRTPVGSRMTVRPQTRLP